MGYVVDRYVVYAYVLYSNNKNFNINIYKVPLKKDTCELIYTGNEYVATYLFKWCNVSEIEINRLKKEVQALLAVLYL